MAKQAEDIHTEDWVDEVFEEVDEEEVDDKEEEEVSDEVDEETDEKVDEEKEEEKKPEEDPRFRGILNELQAERQKRQELEQRMQKYDTLWEKLEGEEEEKEEVPEFEYDPTANLNARLEKTEKLTQQQQQLLAQQQQMQALGQAVQASETAFVAEHPDYYDALEKVRGVQRKAYEPIAKAQGWTEAQLNQYIAEQELAASAQLLQAGVDPAQYAYQVAQTYGYQPNPKDEKDETEEKLDRMEKGLKVSRKPSGGGKLTKEEVDSMTLHEFEEAMAESFGTKH